MVFIASYAATCRAEPHDFTAFSRERALAYSQAALGRTVGAHRFLNHNGEAVELDRFHGRPLVVSLIYTSCYHTCPALTRNLAHAVDVAREALGEDSFRVVSIGFDSAVDTPARMNEYAREQGISVPGWDFLSGEEATIRELSEDLGFIFFPSPKGFDHLAQTTIIDTGGRVYRQVYGNTFETPQLVEPLKELLFGTAARLPVTVSDWIDNIRLFCTIYDPSTGRYRFDYSVLVSVVAGLLCLGMVMTFVVHAWRTRGRSKPVA
ncbi:MAG: SCO family protein [Gammaproteobacteria bacterium]|nr:SCO family protein [Gammaproteobacteria bacterium]